MHLLKKGLLLLTVFPMMGQMRFRFYQTVLKAALLNQQLFKAFLLLLKDFFQFRQTGAFFLGGRPPLTITHPLFLLHPGREVQTPYFSLQRPHPTA